MTFTVICIGVAWTTDYFTIGKKYEVTDGMIIDDEDFDWDLRWVYSAADLNDFFMGDAIFEEVK